MAMLTAAGLCASAAAHAVPTIVASSLLSAAQESRLESWLGEGNVQLTNIYTKAAGDTSLDFHRATDGRGRTFSVMEASDDSGRTWLVGGYNPQSWNSDRRYNLTPKDSDRTAFIFNLTSDVLRRQTPSSYPANEVGAYQTYNAGNFGPTFGMGNDLLVPENLSSGGMSYIYSYINADGGGFGTSLLDGSPYRAANIRYGAIQVFSIGLVPEPGSYAMLAAGLAVLGLAVQRKAS